MIKYRNRFHATAVVRFGFCPLSWANKGWPSTEASVWSDLIWSDAISHGGYVQAYESKRSLESRWLPLKYPTNPKSFLDIFQFSPWTMSRYTYTRTVKNIFRTSHLPWSKIIKWIFKRYAGISYEANRRSILLRLGFLQIRRGFCIISDIPQENTSSTPLSTTTCS